MNGLKVQVNKDAPKVLPCYHILDDRFSIMSSKCYLISKLVIGTHLPIILHSKY